MQAMANVIVGLVALVLGLTVGAAVIIAALNAYFGAGWFTRLWSKERAVPLNDPDPLNALAARDHVDHGRRIIDHSNWHETTSDGGSGGD